MAQPVIVLLALAVVICCLSLTGCINAIPFDVTVTEESHNVYQCPDPTNLTETPLCRLTIEENGHIFQTLTKTVDCPESGINKNKLGCIMVTNLDDNDNGGYASIQNGGLDQYYVEIYLKSQWGKGLNFRIEVYTYNSTISTAIKTQKMSPDDDPVLMRPKL